MPDPSQSGYTLGPADDPRWSASAHAHGRGVLDPANVVWEGSGGRLILPAGRPDGGEVVSAWRFQGGSFSARIRAASAPGSVVTLALCESVPGKRNDAIELEIANDGSGRA